MAQREANIVVRLRDRATSGLKKFRNALNKTLKVTGLVAGALAGLAAIGGARFLAGAIRTSGEFGEQMSILQGLTQGSAEEMKALETAARDAGASTRFSATEAGQGLEELVRSGQSATEAVSTLNPVLSLAAGNNQTVAESAIQVTTALNAFGLAADQAGRVSDVYTRAAQRSAQTTNQLGEAMTFVAPVARQAGLEIEQTAALIGRLADAGFRGSLGGTALRNAILQFQDPASNFRAELEKLGIRTDNFVEALSQLAGSGDEAEAAIRSLGLRAGPAIQAIVAGGAPALRELTGELYEAAGASEEAAKAMEDNLPGAFRNLKSAFSELQIALTQPLTEEITEGVFDLAEAVRNFAASDTLTGLRDLLTETFRAGRRAVEQFIGGIDFEEVTAKLQAFIERMRTGASNLGEQADRLSTGFTRITGATNILIGTVRAAFNGLGTVIAGVVTAAAFGLEKLFALFKTVTFGLDGFINATAQELADLRQSFAKSTGEFAEGFLDASAQIGRGFDQMAAKGKASTDQTSAQLDKQAKKTREAEQAVDEWRESTEDAFDAAGSWGEAGTEAGAQVEEAAGGAAGAMGGLGDETSETTRKVRELSGTATNLRELRAEAEAARTPFEILQQKIEEATDPTQVNALIAEMGRLREEGEITKEQYQELADTVLNSTVSSFDELRQAIVDATSLDELFALARQVDELAFSGKLTTEQIYQLNQVLRESRGAMFDAGSAADSAGDSYRNLADQANTAAVAMDSANAAASRGASAGARHGVSMFGDVLDSWAERGPKAAAEVQRFIDEWNRSPSGTFQGFSARLARFTENMERRFGHMTEEQLQYNDQLTRASDLTKDLDEETRGLATQQQRASGTESIVHEKLEIEFKRERGEQFILSEQQLGTIVRRVVEVINRDRDRTS